MCYHIQYIIHIIGKCVCVCVCVCVMFPCTLGYTCSVRLHGNRKQMSIVNKYDIQYISLCVCVSNGFFFLA